MRLREVVALQDEISRAFREARAWQASPPAGPGMMPPTDLSRDDAAYYIRCDLPGVVREQVRVRAEGGVVSISGNKQRPERPQARTIRDERRFGQFSLAIPLPTDADWEQVEARCSAGVLEVKVGRTLAKSGGGKDVPVVWDA